ncbi:GroES-like protein [Lindgomyces ingoldianus]|uniref:GroES-like protein n=1 Tax=Lindgomyces ingoldianus TaxID=673940 RepID=A0ACB6QAB8_9PLEO|nr:GroES-like protein [Lindgomyces ingoldianus]KAF2463086.1 GroES-like protein [Lindgomyces ingoldianus]
MSTQRAVVHKSEGVAEIREDVPLPKLRDDYILVKTKAVALNPTDWKAIDYRNCPGAIAGCDYSGIVEAVGKHVTTPFKPGDRIAGFARGANPDNHNDGAFAEHITAKGDLQMRLADNISYTDAATLGVGITTVAQALYQSLGLPFPPAKVSSPTPILIYGASTATGTLAIQFAKLSGCEVFATASPHNLDLLRNLGADHVFDYREPGVGAKIHDATNNKLALVLDCITDQGSPEICCEAISSNGGHYSALGLNAGKLPRDDVKNSLTVAYSALGERFSDRFPAKLEDFEFAVKFWRIAEELVNSGRIKAHPAEVREGGLDGVIQGLKDLKDGKVSAVKLVYEIA